MEADVTLARYTEALGIGLSINIQVRKMVSWMDHALSELTRCRSHSAGSFAVHEGAKLKVIQNYIPLQSDHKKCEVYV